MPAFFDFQDYGTYIEQDFRYRWLRPVLLYEKLKKFRQQPNLRFKEPLISLEGRDVPVVEWGNGPIKILLWSQMHGNEPTATMALIDLLNFLSTSDKYDAQRSNWQKKVTVKMLLMLNPDGAERNTRHNALGVDLNRDARARQSPEIRQFWKLAEEFGPHWAFNLHDQRSIFSAGDTGYPATISFLAPSADAGRGITASREKSMKLISYLAQGIKDYLPHHTGRYSDEFYPRALGDCFQQKDVPCVLIESGAFYGDEFRDQARKLNFCALAEAFNLIATGEYEKGTVDEYLDIPKNHTNMYDLVLRGCELKFAGKSYVADLALHYREETDFEKNTLDKTLILKEIGDLSQSYGLVEEEGGSIELENKPLPLEQPADFTVIRKEKTNLIFKKGKTQWKA